ncbi:PREDICTED: uncharacterized protein LOC109126018 [Camelina sativa]|uniref:Uncharacterized protein LOC109125864 n=1 Tax=Camelina sativa TaxID=90675 RepID=A0ABM1QB97_CAMSA|nr:PREDICTED: uncharacterized protein LOC109125864 [Camelina sativa]XP_019084577.1 PREDICTED: uncharacterized protein LOC109126018 [Camelina sativa]
MGLIRSYFSFVCGTICGVYVAQSYNVPNIEKVAQAAYSMAKQMEERYRKTKTKSMEDFQD